MLLLENCGCYRLSNTVIVVVPMRKANSESSVDNVESKYSSMHLVVERVPLMAPGLQILFLVVCTLGFGA